MATGTSFNNILRSGIKIDLPNKAPGAVVVSADANGSLSYLPLGANGSFLGVNSGSLSYIDFTEAAQDAIGSLITASGRITPTYNDTSNTLTLDINPGSINGSHLAQATALSIRGNPTNASANQSDIAFATDGGVLMRSGTTLTTALIQTANIANAAVTYSKIQNIAANSLVGNLSGSAAAPTNISINSLREALRDLLISVTGATQAITAGSTYIANNPTAEIIFTLPSTAIVGDSFFVIGRGAGGWRVNQSVAGQSQICGTIATTPGVTSGLLGTVRNWTGEFVNFVQWVCVNTATSIEWYVLPLVGNLRIDE
jgi:hypothetical protein